LAEVLELTALTSLGHAGHTKDTCAFCTAPTTPTSEKNELGDEEDEDANEIPGLEQDGVAHRNSGKKLGQALIGNGSDQLEGSVKVKGIDKPLAVHTAAHHLVPGNASLKESDLMRYLHEDGMKTGNIGYNVNTFENGSWLAGNYALRGKRGLPSWGPEGSKFLAKTGVNPKQYAFAAIPESGRQFHDAHVRYSTFVTDALDLLAKKMDKTKDLWCPEAKSKPKKPEERQLFMLVNRLNTISRRLRIRVENPGRNWKVNIYTSRFSEQYIKEKIYKH